MPRVTGATIHGFTWGRDRAVNHHGPVHEKSKEIALHALRPVDHRLGDDVCPQPPHDHPAHPIEEDRPVQGEQPALGQEPSEPRPHPGISGTICVRQYSRVSTRHDSNTTTSQNTSMANPRLE